MKKIRLLFLFFLMACSPQVTVTPEVTVTSTPQALEVTATTQVLTETPVESETVVLDFAISPDGKKLAVYLNTGVYLYDIETLQRTVLYEFEIDEYYSELIAHATFYPQFDSSGALAFTPDGNKIAISSKLRDEFIHVWDLKTHKIVDYIGNYPNGNFIRELTYSPTGDELLIRSTYPKARIQCPEMADPPEDTLTLVSLISRRNLFEEKNCTRYSVYEFYFYSRNTMYFFLFGASSVYYMYQVDIQTGDVLTSEELNTTQYGRIYALSQNGSVFASVDHSSPDSAFNTIFIDTETKKKLLSITGRVAFLGSENRYLVSTFEIQQQGELELYENGKSICTFDGIEYYRQYTKISKDNNILVSLSFDNRVFKNSIQIWDISSCKLINTIPLN